jgi:hypothetical protein
VVDGQPNEKPAPVSRQPSIRGNVMRQSPWSQSLWTRSVGVLWLGLLVFAPKAGHGNEANDQLLAASEEHRRLALQVVIGGAGDRCDRVIRTFFQGQKPNGEAVWNIECDTDSYSVVVAADGKTKLITCGQLMRLGGMQCFKPM